MTDDMRDIQNAILECVEVSIESLRKPTQVSRWMTGARTARYIRVSMPSSNDSLTRSGTE
jgi:hypothetical protein